MRESVPRVPLGDSRFGPSGTGVDKHYTDGIKAQTGRFHSIE